MLGANESLKLTSKLYNRICRYRRRKTRLVLLGLERLRLVLLKLERLRLVFSKTREALGSRGTLRCLRALLLIVMIKA